MLSAKVLQVISVCAGLLAIALSLAAVTTQDWIKVCNEGSGCYHLGLHFYEYLSMKITRADAWNKNGQSIGDDGVMNAAGALMLCAVAFLFIATCFVMLNACRIWMGRNSSTSLHVGVVLLSFAVVLMLIGLIMFTSNQKVVVVEKPTEPAASLAPIEVDIDDLLPLPTGESPSEDDQEIDDLYNYFFNNDDLGSRRRRDLTKMDEATLSFGNSFRLAWVAFGMILIAQFTALLAAYFLRAPHEEEAEEKKRKSSKVTIVA